MSLLGGFTPLVLHDGAREAGALEHARAVAELLSAAGASTLVSCPVMDEDWSVPRPLSGDEHRTLVRNLAAVDTICDDHGLTQVLHPTCRPWSRPLPTSSASSRAATCAGAWTPGTWPSGAPTRWNSPAGRRTGSATSTSRTCAWTSCPPMMDRSTSIMEGVQAGLFPPLGQGDLALADVVVELERSGYRGWYVIEQDTAITGPLPGPGEGPAEGVAASMRYLHEVVAPLLEPST